MLSRLKRRVQVEESIVVSSQLCFFKTHKDCPSNRAQFTIKKCVQPVFCACGVTRILLWDRERDSRVEQGEAEGDVIPTLEVKISRK